MGYFNFKQKKNRGGKYFKHKDTPERQQEEPDVIAMLKRMQQQLGFLEKKVDMLLGREFPSKPFRSEGHSGRHDNEARGDSSGKRNFHKGKKPFPFKRRPR